MGSRFVNQPSYLAGVLVFLSAVLSACSAPEQSAPEMDYAANAQRWVETEFQPSTLSKEEQLAELAWFTQAAEPFRGMSINVVSETLHT